MYFWFWTLAWCVPDISPRYIEPMELDDLWCRLESGRMWLNHRKNHWEHHWKGHWKPAKLYEWAHDGCICVSYSDSLTKLFPEFSYRPFSWLFSLINKPANWQVAILDIFHMLTVFNYWMAGTGQVILDGEHFPWTKRAVQKDSNDWTKRGSP